MRTQASSIAEYIAAAPTGARERLAELYACLQELAPGAEEGIKWGVPALSYKRILFTFAAFKSHISFFPTPSVIAACSADLAGHKHTASGVQFPLDRALPLPLIRRLAALRVKECLENDARWM